MAGSIRKALRGTAARAAILVLGAPSAASAQQADSTQPQEQGLAEAELSKLQRQEEFSGYIDSLLSAMEAARRSGNCDQLQDLKAQIELGLGLSATSSLFPPETIAAWKRRADAILQRSCPPSSGAPPVESVVDDLRSNPATIIGTPERPAGRDEAPSATPSPPTSGLTFDEPEADERFPGDPFYYLLQIFFDYREEDVPDTGIGFRRDGPSGEAPETFAATTPDRVNMIGGGGSVGFPLGGTRIRIGLGYREGGATNSFAIPGDSGVDSGVVYGDDAPSGSSGIATPFGLSGTTSVEQQSYGGRVEVDLHGGEAWSRGFASASASGAPTATTLANVSTYFGYEHSERDYEAFADYSGGGSPFVFEFGQVRRQEVSENYFSAGLSGRLAVPFGGGLFGHLNARGGGYYRDGDLASFERNLCNFCPASDQDFTIEIEDSDDGFGFEGRAGAGLEFRVSPAVSLNVGGSVDYRSDVGAIFNPNSGDQVFFDGLATALETEDSWSWGVGGGIVVRFGGR